MTARAAARVMVAAATVIGSAACQAAVGPAVPRGSQVSGAGGAKAAPLAGQGERESHVDPPPVARSEPPPDATSPSPDPPRRSLVVAGDVSAASLTRQEVRAALARGPGWLLGQVPLEPVIAAGRRFLGFRIVRLFDEGERVRQLPLRAGDIVQRVNGVWLRTPDDLMRICSHAATASALHFQLLRDGVPIKAAIPIADVDVAPSGHP